jgi:hypothetical protein
MPSVGGAWAAGSSNYMGRGPAHKAATAGAAGSPLGTANASEAGVSAGDAYGAGSKGVLPSPPANSHRKKLRLAGQAGQIKKARDELGAPASVGA